MIGGTGILWLFTVQKMRPGKDLFRGTNLTKICLKRVCIGDFKCGKKHIKLRKNPL